MKQFVRLALALSTLVATTCHLQALNDYPSPYSPPMLKFPTFGLSQEKSTFFDFDFSMGNSEVAFDYNGDKTALFSAHGLFDFKKLGTYTNYAAGSATRSFLETIDGYDATDGKLECSGAAEFRQVVLSVKHIITSGLFASVEIPLKSLQTDNYTFKIRSGDPTTQTCLDHVNDNLDSVLIENSIEPLTTKFHAEGLSDVIIGGGWQSNLMYENHFLNRASGIINAGIILPTSSICQPNEEHLFSLPLGNNSHWGVNVYGAVELEISPYLVAGATGSSKTFFKQTRIMRLKTDKDQSGPFILDQGEVKVDLGSSWKAGGYMRSGSSQLGINVLIGYSFHSKEQTRYELTKKEITNDVFDDGIIESDKQLEAWNQHSLHGAIIIEPAISSKKSIHPRIELSCHYPLYLESCPEVSMVKFGMGAAINWKF